MRSAFSILLLLSALGRAEALLDIPELEALRQREPERARAIVDEVNQAGQRLALSFGNTFVLRRTTTDEAGTLHARFEQRYHGLRVHGGELIAHVSLDGNERTLTSSVFPGVEVATRPAISREAALRSAGGTGEAELMIWPERELLVRGRIENGNANYEWRPRQYRLVWRIDANPRIVLVDAHTGAMESRDSADYDLQAPPVPPNASARTLRYGPRGINTRQNVQTQLWELADPNRGNSSVGNHNYSTVRQASTGALYTDADNTWGDSSLFTPLNGPASANGQTAAADVAFAIRNTWDMFRFVFKRSGLDGKGAGMQARVHYGNQFNDAFWVDSERTAFFGDGTGIGALSPRTAEDIVGHEFGHGFWFFELGSDGGKGTESDGLNEGHADIMGSLVEMYLRTGGSGPTFNETIAPWNWRTRMVDPAGYSEPLTDAQGNTIGTSVGFRYYDPKIGKAAEHANGCLYGHYFVMLAHGSSSDPSSTTWSKYRPKGIAGIGVTKAARVWYRATTAYLPPNPTYLDTRKAWIDAVTAMYGKNSPEYHGVMEAWAAIGLSKQPQDNFTIQF